MSFKMIFEATNKAVTYDDKAKPFRVTGFLAICRMEARVAVLPIGFTCRSDPIDKCPPAVFAVIGNEVKRKHYEEETAR